jgi:hypothetical protein
LTSAKRGLGLIVGGIDPENQNKGNENDDSDECSD